MICFSFAIIEISIKHLNFTTNKPQLDENHPKFGVKTNFGNGRSDWKCNNWCESKCCFKRNLNS